jgi:cell division protein FtsL
MVKSRNAQTGIRTRNTKVKKHARLPSGKQVFLAILLLCFLLLTGIGYVWSNFERTQLGYSLSELKREELRLKRQNRKLRLELALLKSPETLEARAVRKFGLKHPRPEQIVILP